MFERVGGGVGVGIGVGVWVVGIDGGGGGGVMCGWGLVWGEVGHFIYASSPYVPG